MDLQHLRASDGTGEAVLAHIQTVRNPGSTVLDLDNVDNWNSKAVIITGTPAANGFVSPVGLKVMYGHLSAGDFIIDGYAPGYADNGNTTAEVAIVKMTTSWADTLVDLLDNSLQDNGLLKITSLDHFYKPSELVFDHIASGAVLAGLGYGSTLTASLSAGVAYINGIRQIIAAVATRTYTASKDTYVDALYNASGTATIVYTEVANNAVSPALAANSIRLGIVVSGANIASVASINQGQVEKALPIASNVAYSVTDSLGNLICSRSPDKATIGYKQRISAFSTTAVNTPTEITGLQVPVLVPEGKRVRITAHSTYIRSTAGSGQGVSFDIFEGATQLSSLFWAQTTSGYHMSAHNEVVLNPTPGLHTYTVKISQTAAGTVDTGAGATQPQFILVELI